MMKPVLLLALLCPLAWGRSLPDLLVEVQGAARAEQPESGADTFLEAAGLLRRRYPEETRRLAAEALKRMSGVRDARTLEALRIQALDLLTGLDLDAAEDLAARMPALSAPPVADPRVRAWDNIAARRAADDLPAAVATARRALAAGVFGASPIWLADALLRRNPAEAKRLLVEILRVYPGHDPYGGTQVLLEGLRQNPDLAREALPGAADKLLAAIQSPRFVPPGWSSGAEFQLHGRRVVVRGARAVALMELAGLMRAFAPPLYRKHRASFQPWAHAIEAERGGDVRAFAPVRSWGGRRQAAPDRTAQSVPAGIRELRGLEERLKAELKTGGGNAALNPFFTQAGQICSDPRVPSRSHGFCTPEWYTALALRLRSSRFDSDSLTEAAGTVSASVRARLLLAELSGLLREPAAR